MSAFDDLTLGEVEEIQKVALGDVQIGDADPLMVAGGVLWMMKRRDDAALTWPDFKLRTTMREIKEMATQMQAETDSPLAVES